MLGLVSPTVATAVRGRDESRSEFADFARTRRSEAPLFLIHAPSAGEWRHAESVVRSLRAFRPGLQFAFTYTSPSARPVAAELKPDVHGFLPWDRRRDVTGLLDQLRPAALIVTKLDLWPELALQAKARGIPIIIIAATVRPDSTRLNGPAKVVLRSAYEAVDLALAVGPEDAVRLAALGVNSARISLVGDPRYDSVLERISGLPDQPSPQMMVAGSTWRDDEEILLSAFPQVLLRHPKARLMLVPHRPGEDAIRRIRRMALRSGLDAPVVAAQSIDWNDLPQLSVVNEVGPLATLYGRAMLTYVGGGFGRKGLHSVLEPAAWGRTVIVGPNWRDSRDAEALKGVSALTPLPGKKADAGIQLAWHWTWFLESEKWRTELALAAQRVVLNGSGAANFTAGFILELLQKRGS